MGYAQEGKDLGSRDEKMKLCKFEVHPYWPQTKITKLCRKQKKYLLNSTEQPDNSFQLKSISQTDPELTHCNNQLSPWRAGFEVFCCDSKGKLGLACWGQPTAMLCLNAFVIYSFEKLLIMRNDHLFENGTFKSHTYSQKLLPVRITQRTLHSSL